MANTVPERPVAPGIGGAGGGAAVPEPVELGDAVHAAADLAVDVPTAEALGIEVVGLSPGRLALLRFRRHRLAMVSVGVLAFMTFIAIAAPLLTHHGYEQVRDFRYALKSPGKVGGLFGTDTLGRDVFSRVLYGGRVSLAVGAGVAFVSTIVGTIIGSLSGFHGGRLDNFLMRVTDLFLAMPLLVILILASKALGGSIFDIVAILSAFFWMPVARIVRGLFLSLKEKEFVEAARAMGASNTRIMFRHILPNCVGPITVNATLAVAQAILTESLLSFLGFGIQPPVPTWGNLLDYGRRFTTVAPWLVWFPGMAILVTVLAVNFLGDGLRDALDPTQRRMRA